MQPVEQEDEHAHHGDGCRDAGPDGEVEGREQGEDVDLFFRFSQQDAHAVVQVALAEVDDVLALWCDGDGRHRQVSSLEEEEEEEVRKRGRTVNNKYLCSDLCECTAAEYI